MAAHGIWGSVANQGGGGGASRATYSLRLVNPDYTGPAIQIVDIRGGPPADLYFEGGWVNPAGITQVVGRRGSGYVFGWYDQWSGEYHATNSGNGSTCYLVHEGLDGMINGKCALFAQDANSFLEVANFPSAYSQPWSVISLAGFDGSTFTRDMYVWSGDTTHKFWYNRSGAVSAALTMDDSASSYHGFYQTQTESIFTLWDGASSEIYVDGYDESGAVPLTTVLSNLTLGNKIGGGNRSMPILQELDFHFSDQSTNRSTLMSALTMDFNL